MLANYNFQFTICNFRLTIIIYRLLMRFFLKMGLAKTIRERFGQNNARKMNEQMILEELLDLLKQGAVQIRQDALGGSGGGLCTVQGKRIFFLDTQAPTDFLIQMCAEAVPDVIDIENVYIKPQIRQLIENSSKRG